MNPLAVSLRGASALHVPRRRSGGVQTLPVNVLDHDGATYLVSARGEADWVRNLRAAGHCRLRHRGRTVEYTASEIPVDERAGVLAAYRRAWGWQVGAFFRSLPDDADHPVFRLAAR